MIKISRIRGVKSNLKSAARSAQATLRPNSISRSDLLRPHPKLADAGVILREATGNYDRATVVLRTLGEESGLPASSTRWTLQALANFTFNLPSTAAMKSPAEFGLVGEVVTDLGFGPKERLQVLRRLAAAGGGSLSAEDASSGSTQLNEFTGLYRAHYPVGA